MPRIFLFTIILLLTWTGFVALTGWRADLAESNLQANLIRITRYLNADDPKIVLAGSSVGGRLLPDSFKNHGLEVYNLGLDGSRPLFVFEVLRKKDRLPDILLVETSALFQDLQPNDTTLRAAVNSPTATMSRFFPFFRPELRPSSVVYEKVKGIRDRGTAGVERTPVVFPDGPQGGALPETYQVILENLQYFQKQGVQIVILDLPRGEGWAQVHEGAAKQLADDLGVPFLQPGPEIFLQSGNSLRFSDGLHLNAPSAEVVTAQISQWLQKR